MIEELRAKLLRILRSEKFRKTDSIFSKIDSTTKYIWWAIYYHFEDIHTMLERAISFDKDILEEFGASIDSLLLLESDKLLEELVSNEEIATFLNNIAKLAHDSYDCIKVRSLGKNFHY